MRSLILMAIVVCTSFVVFQATTAANGAEWRNGVYYPTTPGDQMYSYYSGDHGQYYNIARRVPTPAYRPRPYVPSYRGYYSSPAYRPYGGYRYTPPKPWVYPYYGGYGYGSYGARGGVDIGSLHIRW